MTTTNLPAITLVEQAQVATTGTANALGLITAALFFIVFLGWAAFAPLDAAAPAGGQLIVAGHRQTVQHRDGGVVESIRGQGRPACCQRPGVDRAGRRRSARRRGALATQTINLEAERRAGKPNNLALAALAGRPISTSATSGP